MAKPRFFVDRPVKFSVEITDQDAKHIRDVLRLRPGDVVEVVDASGELADIEIVQVSDTVLGKVVKAYAKKAPVAQVFLFQALPKGAKMDDIVRQVTEVGVTGVYPVISERVVVKVEPDKAAKKAERWQKIASEAAKQSHRTSIPKVFEPLSWDSALKELARFRQVVVFWEEEQSAELYEVLDPEANETALVIGPEGGLSEREVEDLKSVGAKTATLGESILRVETAAPVAAALVFYEFRRQGRQQRLSDANPV